MAFALPACFWTAKWNRDNQSKPTQTRENMWNSKHSIQSAQVLDATGILARAAS